MSVCGCVFCGSRAVTAFRHWDTTGESIKPLPANAGEESVANLDSVSSVRQSSCIMLRALFSHCIGLLLWCASFNQYDTLVSAGVLKQNRDALFRVNWF